MFGVDVRRALLHGSCGILMICLSITAANSSEVPLIWDYDASGASGFALYCGTSTGAYTWRIDVGNTTDYTVTGLSDGTTYFCAAVAYDADKVESPRSNEVRFDAPVGTIAPTPSPTPTSSTPAPVVSFLASPSSGTAPLSVSFANTSTGMVTSWSWNFGDGSASTLQSPTHLFQSPALYSVTLTATGPGGTSTLSSPIVVTSAPVSGLVAAYSFSEGAGTTILDSSGNGNVGVIDGVEWTTTGRFGKALRFNGTGWVTVKDSPSLQLNTLTLEAWVYPTVPLNGWIDLIMKETADGASYYLCASSQWGVPVGGVAISEEKMVLAPDALPINEWSHVATTYDGSYQRMYVNGVLVASHAQQGRINTSAGVLRLGGDSVWGERFTGLIDEVRVYNRALLSTEIRSDMDTPISQQ